MNRQTGYSMIELIVFIVVIGITVPSIIKMISLTLNNINSVQQQNTAIASASQCLEWFLNTRYNQGYAVITCPSSTVPALCSAPTGYTLSVNISYLTLSGDANYKKISVTISGKGHASDTLIIANY